MTTAHLLSSGGSRQYVELIGRDDTEYRGRVAVRSMMLSLSFAETDRPQEAVRPVSAPGYTWKIVAEDGVVLGMRSRDFADPVEALRDLDRVAEIAKLLHVAVTVEPATGRMSYWLMHEREIIVVGSRLLRPAQRRTVHRDAERAMAAVRSSARCRDGPQVALSPRR